jgi:hypothetical protein
VIGVIANLELGEAVATEDDPLEGRGQRLDRLDPPGEERSVAGAGVVGLGGLVGRGGDTGSSLRVP